MKAPAPVVLVLLVILSSAPAAFADSGPTPASGFTIVSAVWGTPTSPVEAGAGSVNVPLTVTVQYYFANTATGVKATLSPPFEFTDANGNASPTAYAAGNIPSGTVLPLTFYLNIARGTPVGSFVFGITMTWGALLSGSAVNSMSLIQQSSVNVNLFGRTILTYQATPSVLTAGDITHVSLSVTNSGTGRASDVLTSISVPPSVSVLNSVPEIGLVEPNGSASEELSVFAPTSSAGSPVTLTVASTYFDAYGIRQAATQPVGFVVAPARSASPLGLSFSPTFLVAGQLNNLTIELSNGGNQTISSISATFAVVGSQAAWLGSNLVQSQSLQPGRTLVVPAQVYDSPSASGSVTVQCALTYNYGSVPYQETRTFGLLSRGLVDVSLTGSTVLPDPVTQGHVVSLTLTLTNLGTIAASAVTASALFQQGFTAIGSGSQFIGDMPVDSPSTFTLSAFVSNSTEPGEHTVQVRLGYFDNLRTPLSKTLNLTVLVSARGTGTTGIGGSEGASGSASGGGSALTLAGYAAAAVIVAGMAVYWVRRRRRRSGA